MKPRKGPPQRGGKRRQQQRQPEVMYRRAAPVGPPPERENSRQAFRVTDDRLDAPDGSRVDTPEGTFERHGSYWQPVD